MKTVTVILLLLCLVFPLVFVPLTIIFLCAWLETVCSGDGVTFKVAKRRS